MDKKAEAEQIIKDYHESRQQIREIIAEYQQTERRLFRVMQDKLRDLEGEDTYQIDQ